MEDKDQLVDAAIRHADAVLVVKRIKRKLQEAMAVANAVRDLELLPAEEQLRKVRADLDAIVEGRNIVEFLPPSARERVA